MSKQVVFLGSRPVGYRCFQHLLEQQAAYGVEVIGLLTTRASAVGEADLRGLAERYDVPVWSGLDELLAHNCDYLLSVQYHQILRAPHLAVARELAVNLHMAPLPEYRGCNQFAFALVDERRVFGTTLHVMDTGIDSGPILAERRFAIPKHCFIKTLYDRTVEASVQLFRERIGDVLAGKVVPIDQATLVESRGTATYYRKDIQQLKKIDLDWPAEKIWRHVRATSMPGFEPPYAELHGVKIYLNAQSEE